MKGSLLVPVPGYEGLYKIDAVTGKVYNEDGHELKPIHSKQGPRVELRRPGLRDRLLVSDLLKQVGGE